MERHIRAAIPQAPTPKRHIDLLHSKEATTTQQAQYCKNIRTKMQFNSPPSRPDGEHAYVILDKEPTMTRERAHQSWKA